MIKNYIFEIIIFKCKVIFYIRTYSVSLFWRLDFVLMWTTIVKNLFLYFLFALGSNIYLILSWGSQNSSGGPPLV